MWGANAVWSPRRGRRSRASYAHARGLARAPTKSRSAPNRWPIGATGGAPDEAHLQDLHRDAPSRTACFGTVGSAHAFPRRHRSPKRGRGVVRYPRACWPPGHQTNPDQRRIGAPSVPRWRPRHCGFAGPSPARHHHRPLFGHQEVGLCLSHGGIGVPKGPRGGPIYPRLLAAGAPNEPRSTPDRCPVGASMAP